MMILKYKAERVIKGPKRLDVIYEQPPERGQLAGVHER